jgi:cell division protein FtsQ
VVAASIGIYLGDETRRLALSEGAEDLRRQIAERPEFMVRVMVIEGASIPVSDAIREVAEIEFPVSSFDIDLDDLHAKVAALEGVESVKVHVRSGGELAIEVVERVPVALWRDGPTLRLIDAKGFRVATLGNRADRADLPLLAGPGAEKAVTEAQALFAAAAPIEARIRGLLRVGERRWDLVLDRDQRVMLPETGAVAALERVIAMDEAQQLLARDISLIDMRNPDWPTVRVTPAGIAALQHINGQTVGAD